MYIREEYNLEFKEQVTKTFLKTVSAFANYNDGKVIMGVSDSGDVVGLDNIEEECLKIENMINDSLDPVPNYNIEIKKEDGEHIIILNILKGKSTPYYYRGKAYRRADTSTLPVDRLELSRLVMEGINLNYEEMKSLKQDLQFNILGDRLKNTIGIESLSLDILKTLNLYSKDGYYNIAGELLSDDNAIEYSGIDIVKFGKNINQILYRETLSGESLISQYEKTIEIFERYYQYEEIEGYHRIKKELIPREAFREAVANAIVHRIWDVKTHIQVSMYEDRVEINSPGGLPPGISKEEYLKGNVSVLRNPIIAEVFYKLNNIEKFGTGIARIIQEYKKSIPQPNFLISENNIRIVLPLTEFNKSNFSEDETIMFDILEYAPGLSRAELQEQSGFSKSKTLRAINSLIERNIVVKIGAGPSTAYKLNN